MESGDKRGFKKLFQYDQIKRGELISLLKEFKSDLLIARKFGCDHSTIRYWRKKLGIQGEKVVKVVPKKPLKIRKKEAISLKEAAANNRKYKPLLDNLMGEKINVGKLNYADYVREEEIRQIMKKGKLSPPLQ